MQVVLGWPALPWVLSEKAKAKSLGCVRLSATPWTAAYQASLSMGFSRLEWFAIAFSMHIYREPIFMDSVFAVNMKAVCIKV